MLPLTLITHNDLDGYGVSTIVIEAVPAARIHHVAHYDEVGPVALQACERLAAAPGAEILVVADLRIAPAAALFVDRFARLNALRSPEQRHRLIVLDHHAGTAETLRAYQDQPNTAVTLVLDTTRCATRLMVDHLALVSDAVPARHLDLERLAALVEAVDLWRKDDPRFEHGMALNDALADHVAAYVPCGHSGHDRFLADLLLALTDLAYAGRSPGEIERAVPGVRHGLIDRLTVGAAGLPGARSRARLASYVADDPALLHEVTTEMGRVRIAYDLDADVFQQIADTILDRGKIVLVAGIGRDGSLALRSRAGQAGRVARLFNGGGHPDAAGGDLPGGRRVDRAAAIAQFCEVLGIRPDSETTLTLTLREDAVTYDILDEGLPIRLRGVSPERRSVDALLMPCGRSREQSYAALEGLTSGTRVRLRGQWQRAGRRTSASLRDLEFHATACTIEEADAAPAHRRAR